MNFWVFVGSYLDEVIFRMGRVKELVWITLGCFFKILFVGMGFEHQEMAMGFRT